MPTGNKRPLAVLTALALATGGAVSLTGGAAAATGGKLIYGLTSADAVVSFRSETRTASTPVAIGGLLPGEDVVGFDIRPRTGQLVAVVNNAVVGDRLVEINPTTGATTQLDTLDVQLSGSSFGVDFNPAADALRIVSNNGQNLRHPFATGSAGTTVSDTALSYGTEPAPQITAAGYTNNVQGTASTALYDIDSARDTLSQQTNPNGGTLAVVGNLGVDVLTANGFDIDAAGNEALASLQTTGGVGLYRVNLSSGAASLLGALPNAVEDITIATPRVQVTSTSVTEGTAGSITVTRTGDTGEAFTVDYATSSGTATEGVDFTRTTGTLTFGVNETAKTISVPTSAAGGVEGPETVTVTLSNAQATGTNAGTVVLNPATGTLTINDAEAGTLYALVGDDALRTSSVSNPGDPAVTRPITGLQDDESILGIDIRPATGELYGVGSTGRLYVINPATGAATQRGNAISPAPSGTSFGVDFNPAVDALRIVSSARQNLRVNPTTGATTVDGNLTYATGDTNAGVVPVVAGAGYTNNVPAGTPTVLLDIDTATDSLVRQAPPNEGILNTVATLGVTLSATATVGLDIAGDGGNAFAVLQPDGVASPSLYRIDTSGAASAARLIGAFSTQGGLVRDITLVPSGAANPSPSPSASTTPTQTATPTPTGTTTPNPQQLVLRVQRDTITPGVQGVVSITGSPNRNIEVLAYSRPDTTYDVVRRVSLGEDGTAVIRILPGTNTRLYARYTGVADSDSRSVVQNVATALSLTVVRNGSLDYTFQGRILPRRAGQLITLYRVTNGREVITSQIRTDNSGTYRIRRVFQGEGTFGFLTRTGQNLTNVAGVSNGGRARPTSIYAGPQR